MTYALGRGVDAHDMPAIRAVVREAASDDYRFSSLVLRHRAQRAVPDARRSRPRTGLARPKGRALRS